MIRDNRSRGIIVEDQPVPILMYHSISASSNPQFTRWAVTPELFEEHLAYLDESRYTPITVTDLVNARAGGGSSLPEKPVVLTFDDAYLDFYENAFPALQRHGFVGTLYVPTAYVGETSGWLRDESETARQMASWSQLAEVSAGGIECGSHGHAHLQMDAIPLATADAEIKRSKALLEEHLGSSVFSFAYPHGWSTGAVRRLVRAAGYTSACAVKNMLSPATDDPFALGRLLVAGGMDVDALAQVMAHQMTPLEITLRTIARPVWRFKARSSARLKLYVPDAMTRKGQTQHQSTRQPSNFQPAAMLEVEISQPLPSERPVNADTGEEYRRAFVLVRLHTQPLGLIELFAGDDGFSGAHLARGIWDALGATINEHLREDGMPEVTTLGAEGLPSMDMPPCCEAHDAFLARAPFVSVVIPTHNRPEPVTALVNSILASDYPSDQYEIIVVDNAPNSDATEQIIDRRFGDIAQVRYIREDRAGASLARNCGLAAARGDIVVFGDDDELVDRRWLTEMVRGFDRLDDIGCVTGFVVPMESQTLAQGWFEQFGGYCKEQCNRRIFNLTTHRGESPLFPYTVGSYGAGGSMAFKRSVLLALGGFDTALGPATPTLGGEDIDTMLRVILEGYTLLYEPAAIVRHPPHREYERLRGQIRGYGTGLSACLFKAIVTKPMLLPDFIGKLPHGLLFALSARSPHHAGKRADYPKELTWLEMKGMFYGPLAYLLSRRRVARAASPDSPGSYAEPQPVAAGGTH